MKKTTKRLRLNPQTIRLLTLAEGRQVNGGSMCGPGQISSCVTINCGPPGGGGGPVDTHEFPCTVMTR